MIAADAEFLFAEAPAERPTIGVTGPERGGLATWLFMALAIWRAGGRPLRITPSRPCDPDELDGLVLGGGADVDPRLYGLNPSARELASGVRRELQHTPSLARKLFALAFYPLLLGLRRTLSLGTIAGLDRRRDAMECELLREALHRNLPVLGVCRGAQLINAYMGGPLHRELAPFYIERPQLRTVMPRKHVRLAHDSRLASLLGVREARVNAPRHRAVGVPGERINVAARDGAGEVQAIEHTGHRFVIGLQWHPEFLPQATRQQAIFHELVRHARGHGAPNLPPRRRVAASRRPRRAAPTGAVSEARRGTERRDAA